MRQNIVPERMVPRHSLPVRAAIFGLRKGIARAFREKGCEDEPLVTEAA